MNIFTHPTTVKIAKGACKFLATAVLPAAMSIYESKLRKKEMTDIAKKVVAESMKTN